MHEAAEHMKEKHNLTITKIKEIEEHFEIYNYKSLKDFTFQGELDVKLNHSEAGLVLLGLQAYKDLDRAGPYYDDDYYIEVYDNKPYLDDLKKKILKLSEDKLKEEELENKREYEKQVEKHEEEAEYTL